MFSPKNSNSSLTLACFFLICIFIFLNPAAVANTSVPGPVVSVKPIYGVPTFTVDERPFMTPCFETYHPQYTYFQQFADRGIELFSFSTTATECDYGHAKPVWLGVDFYDYSDFEERMQRVLKANPDAMVIPRINMGTPQWWLRHHEDQLQVLDNGQTAYSRYMPTHFSRRVFPSIASEKWRQDMGQSLRKFLQYVQDGPYAKHIFGYLLGGLHTEEWYHWSAGYDELSGYDLSTRQAFQQWLRRKYETDAALRAAWNQPDVTFETVTVPTKHQRKGDGTSTFRDPQTEMNVIDFYLFYNDIVPETMDYFAAIGKEVTGGTKVFGGFYAFMYEFGGNPEYGHNAISKYNQSKNLDFVFVTASYGNRFLGTGGDYPRSPSYSVMLNGKLWYHDNDVMSFLAPKVLAAPKPDLYGFKKEEIPHLLDVLAVTKDVQETVWMYRRSMGFALCNGFYESFFDLHGGYYDDPKLMEEVARLTQLAKAAASTDRSSISQILIVSDESSCSYAKFASPMLAASLSKTQQSLIKIGAPADHILIDDLERLNTDRYKLVVFLNNYNMTDKQRRWVNEKLKGGNRTLLFCYAPGYFNETKTSVEAMAELTGMRIAVSADPTSIPLQIELSKTNSPLSRAMEDAGLTILGPEGRLGQLFCVEDPSAVGIGTLPGTKNVTLAVKEMGQWTSMYSITPTLPPAAYREIARKAGVHLFNESDDTLYANKSFVCIHANGPGKRVIHLPVVSEITDMMAQQRVAENSDTLTVDMKNGETLILNYTPRP